MIKKIYTVASLLLFSASFAFAQVDDTAEAMPAAETEAASSSFISKNGHEVLPKAGDCAIGASANLMEIESGVLYILRSSSKDRTEIVKVKLSDKTVSKITFGTALDGASFMDIYKGKIYYTVKSSVYAIANTATTASETAICTYNTGTANSGYTYGFAVENDKIYIADAIDFKTNGKAYIFNLTGTLLKDVTAEIGPNGFYFNN